MLPDSGDVDAVPRGRPLVVDLDGTLIRSDLLLEAAFASIGARPHSVFGSIGALMRGKAALKAQLGAGFALDPATLPYDEHVLRFIEEARAVGRPVYLVSASNERLVSAVAAHLGLFAGCIGSDGSVNLLGPVKAARLVETFGERGFDYIGDSAADLPVWAKAAKVIAIRAPRRVIRHFARAELEAKHLPHARPTWRTWAKLLRVHQSAKNALIFLPLLAGHRFDLPAFGLAALAFLAFSLCAAGVYVLNDLFDLQDDRRHRSKRDRPLARGDIPLRFGVLAAPLLIAAALLLGAAVSQGFLAVLLSYLALTSAYTLFLKRKMLIDVVVLGALYTIRVIAGAVAVGIVVSPWLLAFCMSFFMSLALLKRFVELAPLEGADAPETRRRDYRAADLPMVGALAAAAGFNAVTVLALYISTDTVRQYYSTPAILWLVCPVLTYWIGRALMLAQRRELHDDPVVFALTDRTSLIAIGLVGVLVLLAI